MDRPDPKALTRAQGLLKHLGAIDQTNVLTPLGHQMAQFPLDVQLSKMLIVSPAFECSEEIVTIAALLSATPLWVRPRDPTEKAMADHIKRREFGDVHSDHITLLNAYTAYVSDTHDSDDAAREEWCKQNYVSFKALQEAENIRAQLVGIMERQGISLVSSYDDMAPNGMYVRLSADNACERERLRENISKALISGFFLQVAYSQALSDLAPTSGNDELGMLNHDSSGSERQGMSCKQERKLRHSFQTIRDKTKAVLHPTSLLPLSNESKWVIFHSFVYTSGPFIRTVTAIEEDWLDNYAFDVYDLEVHDDHETRMALEYIKVQIARRKQMEALENNQTNTYDFTQTLWGTQMDAHNLEAYQAYTAGIAANYLWSQLAWIRLMQNPEAYRLYLAQASMAANGFGPQTGDSAPFSNPN